MTKEEPGSVPKQIPERLKYWVLNFRIWRYLFLVFGVLGVCTSTLAARG